MRTKLAACPGGRRRARHPLVKPSRLVLRAPARVRTRAHERSRIRAGAPDAASARLRLEAAHRRLLAWSAAMVVAPPVDTRLPFVPYLPRHGGPAASGSAGAGAPAGEACARSGGGGGGGGGSRGAVSDDAWVRQAALEIDAAEAAGSTAPEGEASPAADVREGSESRGADWQPSLEATEPTRAHLRFAAEQLQLQPEQVRGPA
jgi:hypothetical protein